MAPRSLKSNFIWNTSYQVLLILVPIVTIPYVSRILGAEQVGIYSYTNSVASYFVLIAKLGIEQYGVRLISKAGSDRRLRSESFWSAWASQLAASVPAVLLYVAYSMAHPRGGTTIALLWGFWVLSSALDISWLLFGVEEFRLPTIRNFTTKLLGIAFILIFCRDQGDLWAYVLGISITYLANSLLVLPFIGRYVDFVMPRWSEIKKHFIPNLQLFAPIVAMSLYIQMNKILLGQLSSMEQAGFYEYADKIARMPISIISAICTVMLPHMTAKITSGDREGAVKLLGKSLWYMEGMSIGIAFGIASISPELVPLFLGNDYEACVLVIPSVAVALPFIAMSNVIGVQFMLPSDSDKAYTQSVWGGAVVNLAFCVLFIPRFGAMGAAFATIAAELSVLAIQMASVRKELPIKRYILSSLPFLMFGALMYCLVRAIAELMVELSSLSWGMLVLEIVAAVIIYSSLAFIWAFKTNRLKDLLVFLRKD